MHLNYKIVKRAKKSKDNMCPIYLRITENRKSYYVSLGLSVQSDQWKDNRFTKKCPDYIGKNDFIDQISFKAGRITREFIEKEKQFSIEIFKQRLLGQQSNMKGVITFWEERIAELYLLDRAGSARTNKCTLNSFKRFIIGRNIVFSEITPSFLTNYETYLRLNGNKDGGIGVKMRDLRALYNLAILKDVAKDKDYPFKRFKATKFKAQNPKIALTREQVKTIENLELKLNPGLIEAKNIFVFSYYAGGINFKDLMFLKWDNIFDDCIKYTRAKTKRHIVIPLSKTLIDILAVYQKSKGEGNEYIFPILFSNNLTAKQLENKKLSALKKYNKRLKAIAKLAHVDEHVTSYVSRHSFATNMYHAGASVEEISQLMGHQNVGITMRYLKEFGVADLQNAVNRLYQEPRAEYGIAC